MAVVLNCLRSNFRSSLRWAIQMSVDTKVAKAAAPRTNIFAFDKRHCSTAVTQCQMLQHAREVNHHSPEPIQGRTPSFVSKRSSHSGLETGAEFVFRQLLEYKSYTYTYLLADVASGQAILIDPVIETVDRDLRLLHELGLQLVYAVNTHIHADHITGSGELKRHIPSCRSMIAEISQAQADVKLNEGDLISFGRFNLEVLSTPGHTDGCLSFVWHEKAMVFTGDAVLIRGCGRTDFQQGDAGALYDSVHKKILSLPPHYRLFPAHDYTGQTMSTVGEELRYNPRLSKTRSEFIEIMNKLNLPFPKQLDKALPANMVCGVFR